LAALKDSVPTSKLVDVAVAVLQRQDGAFLLAQRPKGKIYEGYWEFPGGKVEAGETAQDALARELIEELGIQAGISYPWLSRIFTYPHAKVRLNFFRVKTWRGEPHPHEGQNLSWQNLPSISVAPLLPANAPVLRALALPPLYAISYASELGADEFIRRLELSLEHGLKLVQLREKQMSHAELRTLALRIQPTLRAHGAMLLINEDVELAREIGADGVQLTAMQLASVRERPAVPWCGASCHDAEELCRAAALGCDFALLSPVLRTLSHPDTPHLGWRSFAAMVAASPIPVYALGGLTMDDMELAWEHGAHGIALMRQAW
jgi:8-oxo-dGTP diphosphatase